MAVNPTQLLEALLERRKARFSQRIVWSETHEHADAPHTLTLLRVEDERPRYGADK
jgi:hypothetical protein